MTPALIGSVRAISRGKADRLDHGRRAITTALVKTPVQGRARVTRLGVVGDEHVYEDHGGPDMALLVYPYEHYAHWRSLGLDLPEAGALGENLTVEGLEEKLVHIGDRFEVGTCMVQVTQPRSPCYKLAARFGRKDMPVMVQDTGYTGYLLRVLVEGQIEAGDRMRLVDRQAHGVTVLEAGRVVNVDRNDLGAVRRIVSIGTLGSSVKRKLLQRIDSDKLVGPDTDRLFYSGP